MVFEKISRIALAVRNLEEAMDFFSDLLNIRFDEPVIHEDSGHRIAFSAFGLELVESIAENSMVDRFIKQRGEGVFALAIKVSDMEQAKKIFEGKGVRFTGENIFHGLREATFHPKDTYGCHILLAAYREMHPATVAALMKGENAPEGSNIKGVQQMEEE
ncbi:VOC family protein [Thermodesulfobacteriota bacterium]